jgi:DNA polymerase III delta prime subunit
MARRMERDAQNFSNLQPLHCKASTTAAEVKAAVGFDCWDLVSFGFQGAVVIDEVDRLTPAVCDVLEEALRLPQLPILLILVTNYIDRVSPRIKSATTDVMFPAITPEAALPRLMAISKDLGRDYTEARLRSIMVHCRGDLRKAIALL